MKKEVENAVETFHRIAFRTRKNGAKIAEANLSCFVSVLTELLLARYENNWYPENPERGSGYRCIRVNTQCIDPTIVKSMKKADICLSKIVGTQELTIWVDPGVVSVRIGEDGSIGTEIVDEEVYNMRKSKTPEVKLEKSGSVETDSSSRSSSPEVGYHMNRSQSASPTSSPQQQTRTSPIMEYNPYSPPTRVNYPMRFQNQHPSAAPVTATTLSSPPPPPKSVSPIRSFPTSMAALTSTSPNSSQHIPSMSGAPASFNSPTADYSSPSQGNIPVTQQQRVLNYTRPRAIFPSTTYPSEQVMEKMSTKPQFYPYSTMPVNFGHTAMSSANFYDIPAMA